MRESWSKCPLIKENLGRKGKVKSPFRFLNMWRMSYGRLGLVWILQNGNPSQEIIYLYMPYTII